jgi:AcrR family transcriptional regulator
MRINPDPSGKPSARRSNEARTDATKRALVAAARTLFVERGYANTATPDIVASAGVTRGALYHHFADKSDLLYVVAKNMAEEVSQRVHDKSRKSVDTLIALGDGAKGYFEAMAEGGRARILLLEAPAILSSEQCAELSRLSGEQALEAGLREALGNHPSLPYAELAALVSAAFDRAALAIAQGAPPKKYITAMNLLLMRLAQTGV